MASLVCGNQVLAGECAAASRGQPYTQYDSYATLCWQAGRYELRLMQQAERHAEAAAAMVAKATVETEAALMERLDQRSKQVAEDNRRLEGYLRMSSKVTSAWVERHLLCRHIRARRCKATLTNSRSSVYASTKLLLSK